MFVYVVVCMASCMSVRVFVCAYLHVQEKLVMIVCVCLWFGIAVCVCVCDVDMLSPCGPIVVATILVCRSRVSKACSLRNEQSLAIVVVVIVVDVVRVSVVVVMTRATTIAVLQVKAAMFALVEEVCLSSQSGC